jgi:hypothetical protein
MNVVLDELELYLAAAGFEGHERHRHSLCHYGGFINSWSVRVLVGVAEVDVLGRHKICHSLSEVISVLEEVL